MNKRFLTTKKQRIIAIVILHVMLLIYSLSGVLAKMASTESFFSIRFCLCYGGIIAILLVYAIGWQQTIKILPLTIAFSSKAITVIWGILWGYLFFSEPLSIGKIIGALLVFFGIVVYNISDVYG